MTRTAILFFCYKDREVCADRVRLLRHHNPDSPIYALFGGEAADAPAFEAALRPFVDDFWRFDQDRTPYWKWKHGDRVIMRWFRVRSPHLPHWDELFVAQWDMLVAAPVSELLEGKPAGATVFTGCLPLSQVKAWWSWARGLRNRIELLAFRAALALSEGYTGEVITAPYVVVCAPRGYLERMDRYRFAWLGFLEYVWPTLGAAWGYANWTAPALDTWRAGNPMTRDAAPGDKVISASKAPVPEGVIQTQLEKPGGARVFHPVHTTARQMSLETLLYS